MGMGLVLDVESETIERYPEDMPLCGDAIASDAYREADSDSTSYSSGEVAGIAVGTFFVTLIIAAGGFYIFLTRNSVAARSRHEMTEITADSPMQNENRDL
jgi:hypothetical protein